MRMNLLITIFFIILITGCGQGSGNDFTKMSYSEIISYVMNHDEIKSDIGGEEVIGGLANNVNIDKEMIEMILKSSPECEGLLTLGNYKWVDIATESAHITAFISLDENKVKCIYTRKKFSRKIIDEP